MKKIISILVLLQILACPLLSKIYADEKPLITGGAADEQEALELLMEHDVKEILEEYVYLENLGGSDLIPYATAIFYKGNDISTDDIITFLLEEETHLEVESVLVELLKNRNIDFDDLLYLQSEDTVELNTKLLLLISDTIDPEALLSFIYDGTDFRARSAMQQLSFIDEKRTLAVCVDLLNRNELTYYQFSAINVGLSQYYRFNSEDETYKTEVIENLLSFYNKEKDDQIRFWIMDSLGWCQDWNTFKNVIDKEDIDPYDRYVFLFSSKNLVDSYSKCADSNEVKYYLNKYYELMTDDAIGQLPSLVNSLSSYRGYAVYRDGVIGLNHHAALMHYNKITGGSNYSNYPNANDVIQATGNGYTVDKESWLTFLNGNSFVAACRPNSASMGNTDIVHFIYKATQLIGIPYDVNYQVNYQILNDNSKVETSQITTLRCDGVVEYVYEYYGYKVFFDDNYWDVTVNNQAIRNLHSGAYVTPGTQHSYYLTTVTTSQSSLY